MNTFEISYDTETKQTQNREDDWEVTMLLEYERERCSQLELRINQKDELLTQMNSLQNELYKDIEELQDKLAKSKSEIAVLKEEKEKALQESKPLRDKEVNKLIHERDQARKAQEDLQKQVNSNEALKNKLDKLQIKLQEKNQQLETTQNKVNELENQVHQLRCKKSQESHRTKKTSEKLKSSRSDVEIERMHKQVKELEEQLQATMSKRNVQDGLTKDIITVLGVQDKDKALKKVIQLKESHKKSKECRKLVNRIIDLIVECSPKGSFTKEPNIKQVWTWLTRLLEQYMQLKVSQEGGVLSDLCEVLECEASKLPQVVRRLLRTQK